SLLAPPCDSTCTCNWPGGTSAQESIRKNEMKLLLPAPFGPIKTVSSPGSKPVRFRIVLKPRRVIFVNLGSIRLGYTECRPVGSCPHAEEVGPRSVEFEPRHQGTSGRQNVRFPPLGDVPAKTHRLLDSSLGLSFNPLQAPFLQLLGREWLFGLL